MENRFRIVYYIPNLVHKSRFAIGAIIGTKDGIRYIPAQRAPCPCSFDFGADQSGKIAKLLERLGKNMPKSIQKDKLSFTNTLELGKVMFYPVMEESPDKWVQRFALPR